jgi:hypothetical protein
MAPTHALSIRQPWAGLIVAGRKSIEVRTWPSHRRGLIYLHASRTVDDRREAWRWVQPQDLLLCRQRGGLIAIVNFIDCIAYRSPVEFAAHATQHLNDVSWFQPPVLYGFQFAEVRAVPFQACLGRTNFFPVPTGLST